VETVSLAFDFLKEETGSMFTENEGNIEHVSSQHTNKQPIYRFRPPQISAITKYIHTHILTKFLSFRNRFFIQKNILSK